MLVTMLDYNDFVGRIGIGRISNGRIIKGSRSCSWDPMERALPGDAAPRILTDSADAIIGNV